MRELAEDDRPREKLLRYGPAVLSDAELVAILLGSGMPGQNAVDIARTMLDAVGGLPGLARSDAPMLRRTPGLGPARAAQLLAAIELGRRAAQVSLDDRPRLDTPERIVDHIGWRLRNLATEELWAVPLDSRNRLVGRAVRVHEGHVGTVLVRPAEVFREALLRQAVSVVVAHNHPSGDPTPSPQDILATMELVQAGKLLDIEVRDHIIIGAARSVSLFRDGYMKGQAAKGKP
jgi:DNA repair protein RadC